MSSATLSTIPGSHYSYDLEAQARALGREAPQRLVLCCDDPGASPTASRQRELLAALCLRSPGATLDDLGVREAILFAVQELGVKEVVLLLHSRCSCLLPESAREASVHEKGQSFMERLYGRMAQGHDQLEAAREHVRKTCRALAADPMFEGVELVGLVQIVESGVVLAYELERDDFEALL